MKHTFLHILPILLTVCFAGCTNELDLSDRGDGGEHTYTLQLAIDNGQSTRGISSVSNELGLKTQWCYGDKVTLKTEDGTSSYEFVIAVPASKTVGDPVETSVVTFAYHGAAIANFTAFTGTLEYDCGLDSSTLVMNGYTVSCSMSAASATIATERQVINGYPYTMQAANDNADHLKCIDNLSATLDNVNLTQSNVIVMSRAFSIIKIILDDFYYPIFGGSTLYIKGFKTGSFNFMKAMVLGTNMVNLTSSTTQYGLSDLIYDDNAQNPVTQKNVAPFCDVASEKRLFTGYAVRDESHKLVAYMPVFETLKMHDGGKITIGLRDSWALDWYFWETDILKPFTLPLGTLYTIDMTQKAGGRYRYESYAAINLGRIYARNFGCFATKNVGATDVTDAGEYCLFGYDTPIRPGDHYPPGEIFANHPANTPYYYFKAGIGTDYLAYCKNNGQVDGGFELPVTYTTNPQGDALISTDIPLMGATKKPSEWWATWVKQLNELPTFDVNTPDHMHWNVPENMGANPFKREETLRMVLGADGNPTTTNPAGVRLSNKRTGHSVFIPVSGVLEASEKDLELHQILESATAQIKEGTEKYASFVGQNLLLTPIAEGKNVRIATYPFILESEVYSQKTFCDLDIAVPVRPTFKEYPTYIKEMLTFIPGRDIHVE